ncbi:MAG TPA: ABC transporter substrate-binding protein [Streptosporangiaceae bacterium]|nr:ABC transporter substrate-binding protein [Streptosporangiaceae bacterium]
MTAAVSAVSRFSGHRGRTAVLGASLAIALAACASPGANGSGSPGAGPPVRGGIAYFAEQPLTPPTYIFPLVSGQYFTVTNTSDFQTLLYQPLYWYGDRGDTSVDYRHSIGNPPVYSDGGRVVTIRLKPYAWSDGETVSARDVGFWINLVKANRAAWANYVPGGFPDNIVSWRAPGPATVELRLNASYNPFWFTYNELSQITPLPIAWDRTSLTAPAPSPTAANLPDTTAAGARAVYAFLNGQATKVASYATSPIWSVVDGPWKLAGLTSDGTATFVPNPSYSGPQKPHLARFVELPFTSAAAEFSVLRAGQASGGPGTSGQQISVGYVPSNDLPQQPTLRSQGYQLVRDIPFGFDYLEPNFNNPKVGPVFRQLYFRQAFQHLIDQTGWIHAYYGGLGVPTYSPVPAQPPNPYANASASADPYPFSVPAARALLAAHGWTIVPDGHSTCARPGPAANQCGPGIRAGQALDFTLMYPSGLPYADGSMTDLQSVARQVGIEIALDQVTAATVTATILSCAPSSASCGWELGNYGAAWLFQPDHYPSGDEIFQTGAQGNVSNFSDPAIDKLIIATTRAPAAGAQAALDAYADQVRLQLPDFWQPSPGTLVTVSSNLRGFVPNAYDFISPEEWYFTRG